MKNKQFYNNMMKSVMTYIVSSDNQPEPQC